MKTWKIQELDKSLNPYIAQVSQKMDLSYQFTFILLKRIYRNSPHLFEEKKIDKLLKHIEFFLNPSLKYLYQPNFLTDVEKASKLIISAIKEKKKILVWGDYDVDGITSSALCYEFFKQHNYEISVHLPSRKEGYGINKQVLEKLIEEKKVDLLITVDCGTSEKENIAFAREKGVQCIITDHHTLPENNEDLPNADAFINPHIWQENLQHNYQDIALAGVGVVFFLMCQVNNDLVKERYTKYDMRELLDIVALGTIADMVPLVGLNRILVKNGLVHIAESKRIGIQALKEVSGYDKSTKITSEQISFGLAPRINAASRMEAVEELADLQVNPYVAFNLLISTDYKEALKLAEKLNKVNSARKKEQEEIKKGAKEQAEKYEKDFALVLHNTEWNQGIIGVVASHMVKDFYKPSFILTLVKDNEGKEFYKGSGRSTEEINLYEALCACKDDLISFGGHDKAGGLKIEKENIEIFREHFNNFVAEKLGETPPSSTLLIDEDLTFLQATDNTFLQELTMLEPFGMANSEPRFQTSKVELKNIESFSMGKHLKLEFFDTTSKQLLHCKLWNTKKEDLSYKAGDILDIVYTISLGEYRGNMQINMKIEDFHKV